MSKRIEPKSGESLGADSARIVAAIELIALDVAMRALATPDAIALLRERAARFLESTR